MELPIEKISMLLEFAPEQVVEIVVKQLQTEGQSAIEAWHTVKDYRKEKRKF